MQNPVSKISKPLITLLLFCITLLFSQCENKQETEVVEMNEVIPQSERDYSYTDTSDNKIEPDPFLAQLSAHLNRPLKEFTPIADNYFKGWKYIPNRFNPDTTVSSQFCLDSTLYQFKSWGFKDSILSINAFYNWLDCFGEDCKEIALGDSTYISNYAFLLFQHNENISFILSDKTLNLKVWRGFLIRDERETNWNYIVLQQPNGISKWPIFAQ